jgi:hypothetical protein
MDITFKPYTRRDGALMLYINRSNGVSVGISPECGFAPYGKNSTQGKRNLWQAAHKVIAEHGRRFTGDLAQHHETGFCAPAKLANGWILVGTDIAEIGGMTVGSDGAYLIADGMILRCGVPLEEPMERETEECDEVA